MLRQQHGRGRGLVMRLLRWLKVLAAAAALSGACGLLDGGADGLGGRAPVEVVGTQLERAEARGGE